MVSETWDIMMNRLDEMLEVPEVRFQGGQGQDACHQGFAYIYERLKLGLRESLVLWCLSRDSFCKFLRSLTVLIPNCIL